MSDNPLLNRPPNPNLDITIRHSSPSLLSIMINFLKRKTAKKQLVTITGTDNHGRVMTEQQEIVTYPRIIRWILPTKVFLEVKGGIQVNG